MSTAEQILAACFWCCAAGVVYAYLGYPLLIYALSRTLGHPPSPPAHAPIPPPRIALLIAAHNEEQVIAARIANALGLAYPPGRLDIVIASDGSDDRTAEICARHGPPVRTLAFPHRRGKAATLNAAVEHLDADIVVLSDANTMMDAAALDRLARWFADPAVGAVCGRLVLSDPATGRNADGLYWKYETFLKRCEARLGGPLGANGGIYAIRRELMTPLPPNTVVDDFVLPLAAKLRTGCRIIYDPEATAHEETAPNVRAEFRRRARIGVGGFQALGLLYPLLHPRHGWTALTFASHKLLRWLCPFLLIGALLTAAALAAHPTYRAALAAQVLLYALSATAAALPESRARRLLRPLPMFVAMNLALLLGFARWLMARPSGIWARTQRTPATASPQPLNQAA